VLWISAEISKERIHLATRKASRQSDQTRSELCFTTRAALMTPSCSRRSIIKEMVSRHIDFATPVKEAVAGVLDGSTKHGLAHFQPEKKERHQHSAWAANQLRQTCNSLAGPLVCALSRIPLLIGHNREMRESKVLNRSQLPSASERQLQVLPPEGKPTPW
jgi:hypothetical protein